LLKHATNHTQQRCQQVWAYSEIRAFTKVSSFFGGLKTIIGIEKITVDLITFAELQNVRKNRNLGLPKTSFYIENLANRRVSAEYQKR